MQFEIPDLPGWGVSENTSTVTVLDNLMDVYRRVYLQESRSGLPAPADDFLREPQARLEFGHSAVRCLTILPIAEPHPTLVLSFELPSAQNGGKHEVAIVVQAKHEDVWWCSNKLLRLPHAPLDYWSVDGERAAEMADGLLVMFAGWVILQGLFQPEPMNQLIL